MAHDVLVAWGAVAEAMRKRMKGMKKTKKKMARSITIQLRSPANRNEHKKRDKDTQRTVRISARGQQWNGMVKTQRLTVQNGKE